MEVHVTHPKKTPGYTVRIHLLVRSTCLVAYRFGVYTSNKLIGFCPVSSVAKHALQRWYPPIVLMLSFLGRALYSFCPVGGQWPCLPSIHFSGGIHQVLQCSSFNAVFKLALLPWVANSCQPATPQPMRATTCQAKDSIQSSIGCALRVQPRAGV